MNFVMNEITSKYNGEITSKTDSLRHIFSKENLNIISQTNSDILSIARNSVGATDILALQGIFSICKTSDWKETKRESLISKLL